MFTYLCLKTPTDDLGFALTLHMTEFPVFPCREFEQNGVINELNIGSILALNDKYSQSSIYMYI